MLAAGGCLRVGVARRLDAGAGERELHQRGAVETDAAAPAPVIGGAEELQRGGDEVGRGRGDRLQVLAIEPAAAGEPAIGAFGSDDAERAADAEAIERRRLQVRLREEEAAQRAQAVRSAERRVGKEWVSTGGSGGSPDN